MSESKPASVVFTNSSLLARNAQGTADRAEYLANDLNIYVRNSNGSKTLEAILSMDPNNSTIGQVVNGQIVAAINTSSDGSVKIDGKNIELNGKTTVTGQLDLMQKNTNWVNQNSNYHNPWSWNNAHIYFNNYLQLLGENCDVTYEDNSHLNGGRKFYSIGTLTPGYLKFTTYKNNVNSTDEKFDGQIARTYIDSSRIETNDARLGDLRIVGHHIRAADDKFVLVSNHAGTNFDNNGSVGFQVYGGIGLGKATIYTPDLDLYIQRGNAVTALGQSYNKLVRSMYTAIKSFLKSLTQFRLGFQLRPTSRLSLTTEHWLRLWARRCTTTAILVMKVVSTTCRVSSMMSIQKTRSTPWTTC